MAWKEALAASSSAGGGEVHDLTWSIMKDLLNLGRGSDVISLLDDVPADLDRYGWIVAVGNEAPQSIEMPEYKTMILTSLRAATTKASSSDQYFVAWSSLVAAAGKAGFQRDAIVAFHDVLKASFLSIIASAERMRAGVAAGLSLKEYESISALLQGSDLSVWNRFPTLTAWSNIDPRIGDLPELRLVVRDDVESATSQLLSKQLDFDSWVKVVSLADEIGLHGEARTALLKVVSTDRGDDTTDPQLRRRMSIALRLRDYGVARQLLGQLSLTSDWRERHLLLTDWLAADPELGKLLEFKAAVRTGLEQTSKKLPSNQLYDFGTWLGFVRLADQTDLQAEAWAAYRKGVELIRSVVRPVDRDRDWKISVLISAGISLNDFVTARELSGMMKSGYLMKQATAAIVAVEKETGKGTQSKPIANPDSDFEILLRQHEFGKALRVASTVLQYTTVAFQAAIAGDTLNSKAALRMSEFQGRTPSEGTPACELKRAFAHYLVADGFDLRPAIVRGEMWVKAYPYLELTATHVGWDVYALRMLNGDEGSILDEVDAADVPAREKAFAIGGAAAVALGIVGQPRAGVYLQDALRLVGQMPDPFERATLLELMARIAASHDISSGCCSPSCSSMP